MTDTTRRSGNRLDTVPNTQTVTYPEKKYKTGTRNVASAIYVLGSNAS